jgi:hypothetical protein
VKTSTQIIVLLGGALPPLPSGSFYLVDDNGAFLVDDDGSYLIGF